MSEYVPTTAEVTEWATDMLCYRLSFEDAEAAIATWLAAHDAEVAAKAWDEGRLAEELAWHHVLDGHPVPEGEMCDECAVVNPYRKAVTK